jgi:preprotein translocase subunit SecD
MHLRIWILIGLLVLSVLFIRPWFEFEQGNYVFKSNLRYGLDLTGGTRILVETTEKIGDAELDTIRKVLEARISSFGLRETNVKVVSSLEKKWVQIEVAEANSTALLDLIKTEGKFEGKIFVELKDKNSLKIGERIYNIELNDEGIKLGNSTYKEGETFKIYSGRLDVDARLINRTLELVALKGEHIKSVAESSRGPSVFFENGWRFRFPIILSPEGAKNFKDVMQTQEVVGKSLKYPLILFLDGKAIDDQGLRIESVFKERELTTAEISGGGESREKAIEEMKKLQAILLAGIRAGELPTKLNIVEVSTISPYLGKEFSKIALVSLFGAVLAVSVIIFLRYRVLKISSAILFTGLSEVLIIFGFAALVKWTIDLPAIAGIIASVGTGVDDQIVITDECLRGRRVVGSERGLKRAFFIIFVAAATTIGALLPLIFVGAGALKGFALTGILGILIGVFITRPAYAKILDILFKEKEVA